MPPALSAHDLSLIAKTPLLAGLGEAARARVLEQSTLRQARRGDTLFLQNDPAEALFLVLDGWVKVFRLTAEGAEAVIHVFRDGETFAEPAVFGLGAYPASAEAATDARLLAIPGKAVVEQLQADPAVALRVIGLFSQRMHALVAETERRQVLSTPLRLATFLLGLIEETPPPATPVTLRLPYDKALIAARLGMTPESFSRALAKLRPHGVESRGQEVRIADPAALAEAVGLSEA